MNPETLQWFAHCAAFWTALWSFRRAPSSADECVRFVVALGVGAAGAHLGWLLGQPGSLSAQPVLALLDPRRGFSVLFVPLGVLLLHGRRRSLGCALASLPLALAVARLGCIVAGCCRGEPSILPWAVGVPDLPGRFHPVPVYELLGSLLLHALARAAPAPWKGPQVLIGLGLLRMGTETLRPGTLPQASQLDPTPLALLWILAGIALAWSARPSLLSTSLPGWRRLWDDGMWREPNDPRRPRRI